VHTKDESENQERRTVLCLRRMFQSISRVLLAPKKTGVAAVAAAAAGRAPSADKYPLRPPKHAKRPDLAAAPPPPPPPPVKRGLRGVQHASPPLARDHAHTALTVKYEDLLMTYGALQTKYQDLQQTLAERESEVAQLRRSLAQLQESNGHAERVAAPCAIGDQHQDQQDHEDECAPSADQLDWVLEIVEAREALEDDTVCHKDRVRLLALLAHHVEAICDGVVDVSTFDLTTIDGVLEACGLCELVTPGTGNCQFYAYVQAATQQCLLRLKRTAVNSPKAAQLLHQLERAVGKLKRGVRGSARLCFDKTYADSPVLESLVEEILRSDMVVGDSDGSRLEIIKGYFDDIATNASDLDTTIPANEWGCAITLIEGAKALGRPIHVLTESFGTTSSGKRVHFQRYAPTDPSGVGTMYMAVDETHARSFLEWTNLLLKDLVASETQPTIAPLVLTLSGNHYSAVVVDPRGKIADASNANANANKAEKLVQIVKLQQYQQPQTQDVNAGQGNASAQQHAFIQELSFPPTEAHSATPSLSHPTSSKAVDAGRVVTNEPRRSVSARTPIVAKPLQRATEPKKRTTNVRPAPSPSPRLQRATEPEGRGSTTTAKPVVRGTSPREVGRAAPRVQRESPPVMKVSASAPAVSRTKPRVPIQDRTKERVPVRAESREVGAQGAIHAAPKVNRAMKAGGARPEGHVAATKTARGVKNAYVRPSADTVSAAITTLTPMPTPKPMPTPTPVTAAKKAATGIMKRRAPSAAAPRWR
jgi:hypothetical protein